MGFTVVQESQEGCLIRATPAGEDGPEFLISAQKALKNLWLSITVDISLNPQVLGTIFTHLIKLQQVIAAHRRGIVIKGIQSGGASDIIARLKEAGIRFQDDRPAVPYASKPQPAPPSPAPPSPGPLTQLAPVADELPRAAEIEGRFKDLQKRLNETLKRRKFLENEKKLYLERLKSLSHDHSDQKLDHDLILRLSEVETQSAQAKMERMRLQKELDQAVQLRQQLEEDTKKITAEVKADEKKKREVLDKQWAEMNKKHDKIKSDFKKKSEARKERLARMSK